MRGIIEIAKYGFMGYLMTWTPVFIELDKAERTTITVMLALVLMEIFEKVEKCIKK